LRLSGSQAWERGWSDTHTLRLLPMMVVSTTVKAGAGGGTWCRNNAAVHTVSMWPAEQLTLRKRGHSYHARCDDHGDMDPVS